MQEDVALEEEMMKKQEEAEKTLAGVLQRSSQRSESQADVCTAECRLSRTHSDEMRTERKRTVSTLKLHLHDKSGGRRQILLNSAELN